MNIGPRSAAWLRNAEISTLSELQSLGPVAAYLAVIQAGHRPSLNLLWSLAAGLEGKRWTDLTKTEKDRLIRQSDRLRDG